MYVCLCSTAPCWSSTVFLNQEHLQAAWLPRSSVSWSYTNLLSLLSSDRKVASHSQGGETRPNREVIARCRLWVGIDVYRASSYKRGMCVEFWRDRAANVYLASVNWCIFHILSSRQPNMVSLKNQCQTLVLRLVCTCPWHHAIYWPGRTYAQPN